MPPALASSAAPVCRPAADNAPAPLRHAWPHHPPPATPPAAGLRRSAPDRRRGRLRPAPAPPRLRAPFSVRRHRGPLGADWLGSISGDRGGRGTGILLQPTSRAGPRAPWLRAPGTTFCNLTPSSRAHSPESVPLDVGFAIPS